jgi:hypothetical protein
MENPAAHPTLQEKPDEQEKSHLENTLSYRMKTKEQRNARKRGFPEKEMREAHSSYKEKKNGEKNGIDFSSFRR